MHEMTLLEVNEAFACVPLVSCKLLSNRRFLEGGYKEMVRVASIEAILDNDDGLYQDLKGRLNVNGGAIAIGHPTACTGVRISLTGMYELRERNKQHALATMCIGGGQGMAGIFENLA